MTYIHLLNAILMLVIPAGFALYVTGKWKIGGRYWFVGAGVFILSQVGHVPFNIAVGKLLNGTSLVSLSHPQQILFNSIFLGLSAGFWEETARLTMYKWWVKKARSWKEGILLGLGHGGAESILIGLLAMNSLLQIVAIRSADINTLVTPERLPSTILNIEKFWSMPWYLALMGSFERILTIPIQLAFSVLVLQVFLKKGTRFYWIALALHAFVDSTAVMMMYYTNVYLTEGFVAIISLLCIGLIFKLRTSDRIETPVVQIPYNQRFIGLKSDRKETNENLEDTIFQ